MVAHTNAACVRGDTRRLVMYQAKLALTCTLRTQHNDDMYMPVEHSQMLEDHHGYKQCDENKIVLSHDESFWSYDTCRALAFI